MQSRRKYAGFALSSGSFPTNVSVLVWIVFLYLVLIRNTLNIKKIKKNTFFPGLRTFNPDKNVSCTCRSIIQDLTDKSDIMINYIMFRYRALT